jgi:hypothetical protein
MIAYRSNVQKPSQASRTFAKLAKPELGIKRFEIARIHRLFPRLERFTRFGAALILLLLIESATKSASATTTVASATTKVAATTSTERRGTRMQATSATKSTLAESATTRRRAELATATPSHSYFFLGDLFGSKGFESCSL